MNFEGAHDNSRNAFVVKCLKCNEEVAALENPTQGAIFDSAKAHAINQHKADHIGAFHVGASSGGSHTQFELSALLPEDGPQEAAPEESEAEEPEEDDDEDADDDEEDED